MDSLIEFLSLPSCMLLPFCQVHLLFFVDAKIFDSYSSRFLDCLFAGLARESNGHDMAYLVRFTTFFVMFFE